MTIPLALFASSYNEDDESGTTLHQNSKASYIPSKNNKNNYMLDGNGNGNSSNNNNNNDKPKNKNPQNMRKTIKQKPSAPNESKLSALLKSMDESSDSENENDDSHSNLVNYKGVSENNNNNNNSSSSMFPPLPELNYKGPSMMQSLSSSSSSSPPSQSSPGSHTPDIPTSSTGAVSNSSYDNMPSTYANQYYKQFVPYMNQSSSEMPEQPKSELIEKLNYIIDILEEQQDYKTNSIFEDLILYAFLGIFVIFIVDSFSRSGKYVR
jgi:hypothetical protein